MSEETSLYDGGEGGGAGNTTPPTQPSQPITALVVCVAVMRSYVFSGVQHQATAKVQRGSMNRPEGGVALCLVSSNQTS